MRPHELYSELSFFCMYFHEKRDIGFPGPFVDYDFDHICISSNRSVEKRINKKALAMFDKAEEEYKDLLERKRIVQVLLGVPVPRLSIEIIVS
jgi:hypothetical protein